MTRTFTRWTIEEFLAELYRFRWTRQITEVHVHHTWIPSIASWVGERSVRAMWKFHTDPKPKGQGWSDLAQHVTIAPDGAIWSGRDWNRAPASAGGHNGTSRAGPFMYEMIGNFDKGKEKLQGAQRDSAIVTIAHVLDVHELDDAFAFKFHRQLGSPKTCPGTDVEYDDFLRELRAYRNGVKLGRTFPFT